MSDRLEYGPARMDELVIRQIVNMGELLIDKEELIGLDPEVAKLMAAKNIIDSFALPSEDRQVILERLETFMGSSTLEGVA